MKTEFARMITVLLENTVERDFSNSVFPLTENKMT